ncbi:PREDICTED: putative L-aspartate dehydrogenase [Nanorana parkeri]|uniref:putative L-aspartate dehydrogenase n=1 Tax=Nanorana parkeri TaxID=125878 RepID=UPI0008546D90|nr:PREDICTED: putative L-aspartate dehydrogenase [Nanorana parkeri]
MSMGEMRRIGIVGFGHVGLYLVQQIREEGEKFNLELAFVWNRTVEKLEGIIEPHLQLHRLLEFESRKADLIVEVAHPDITRDYGELFLSAANLMIGSPTVLSDPEIEQKLREIAKTSGHTLYVPSGALWGGEDIQRMADRGTLKGLRITMTKHPDSFQLQGDLAQKNQTVQDRTILYEGPVRDLCPMAPNNVNTMAAACMAAHTLGFDRVIGVLVADPSIPDWHLVDIEVTGTRNKETGQVFSVTTKRCNPAKAGHVTGSATFSSFWSSLLGKHLSA